MQNGSIASICYFSNGSKQVSKEYLEVFSSGKTAIIDDFKKLTLAGNKVEITKGDQDKGYNKEISNFVDSIKAGKEAPIPAEELFLSTLASFKVIESIKNGGEKIILS
jgi:predicted dehydrogenase